MQIPIEWFRINYGLLDYMNKSTKVELTVPEIKSCYDYIEDLDKRYLEALGGYDPATENTMSPMDIVYLMYFSSSQVLEMCCLIN